MESLPKDRIDEVPVKELRKPEHLVSALLKTPLPVRDDAQTK